MRMTLFIGGEPIINTLAQGWAINLAQRAL